MPSLTSEAIDIECADGVVLRGSLWRPVAKDPGAVVIVNPATGVLARYYHRYARFLTESGFAVITYDYRGIGGSRPPDLRGCGFRWQDWGERDFDAVARRAQRMVPGAALLVVGHSFGGFIPGMSAAGAEISRMLTVGAQYAYWQDYDPSARLRLIFRWHVAMPVLSAIWGYFPGRRLAWLEDLPRGVALQWGCGGRRWESRLAPGDRARSLEGFAAVTAPILAFVLADDELATARAVDRALGYYPGSDRVRIVVQPSDLGQEQIGHFGFFHDRNRDGLWQASAAWLRDATVPAMGSAVRLSARR